MDTTLASFAEELAKDSTLSADRCLDITSSPGFAKSIDSDRHLSEKLLSKMIKGLRVRKRSSDGITAAKWEKVIQITSRLLSTAKTPATKAKPSKSSDPPSKQKDSSHQGLPKTVSEYKSRIEKHKKKMYKNPPALPPSTIEIEEKWYSLPERDEESGELRFKGGGNDIKYLIKDFTPNRTPEEVLRAGSFGGTYFRPITSAVTNLQYDAKEVLKDSVDPAWIDGLDESRMLTSSVYRTAVNKYGVKCGGCLGMWESSGWIADSDPYGWFQWYCRFYQGRRCSDDARQIGRWLKSAGPKGRFRSQLCNKILAQRTDYDDANVSPVIRQTLLHWGLEITPQVLAKHRARVGS